MTALDEPDPVMVSESCLNENSCPNIKEYALFEEGLKHSGEVCV